MNLEDPRMQIKTLLCYNNFSRAKKIARKNNYKETEIEILELKDKYYAAQKAEKWGLYKKAIELYSCLQDTNEEINKTSLVAVPQKNSELLGLIGNKNQEKKEESISGFTKYWKMNDSSEYKPMGFIVKN